MQQRIAVRLSPRRIGNADLAACARPVLDDECAVECTPQDVSFKVAQQIIGCARRKRHDDCDGPIWITVSERAGKQRDGQYAGQRGRSRKVSSHSWHHGLPGDAQVYTKTTCAKGSRGDRQDVRITDWRGRSVELVSPDFLGIPRRAGWHPKQGYRPPVADTVAADVGDHV